MKRRETITGQSSGNRVDGGLEDSVGMVRVVKFEMNTKVVDEKDRLDRVGDRGEDFVYDDSYSFMHQCDLST